MFYLIPDQVFFCVHTCPLLLTPGLYMQCCPSLCKFSSFAFPAWFFSSLLQPTVYSVLNLFNKRVPANVRQACLLLIAALPHPVSVWSTCEQEKETSDVLND